MGTKSTLMKLTTLLALGFPVIQAATHPTVIFGVEEEHSSTKSDHSNPLGPYRPLTAWLKKKTGWRIRLEGYQTYRQLFKNLINNHYAFAYTKVGVFNHAKKINHLVSPIATIVAKNYLGQNSLYYHSAIFTLTSNKKIHTLFDLKGSRFGFTTRYSDSSYVYPVSYLAKNKIDYHRFFKSHHFYLRGQALLEACRQHQVDAGAIWRGEFRLQPKSQQNNYRVLVDIPHLPNPLYAATGSLSSKQKRRLIRLLPQAPHTLFKHLDYSYLVKTPAGFYQKKHALIESNQCMKPLLR